MIFGESVSGSAVPAVRLTAKTTPTQIGGVLSLTEVQQAFISGRLVQRNALSMSEVSVCFIFDNETYCMCDGLSIGCGFGTETRCTASGWVFSYHAYCDSKHPDIVKAVQLQGSLFVPQALLGDVDRTHFRVERQTYFGLLGK